MRIRLCFSFLFIGLQLAFAAKAQDDNGPLRLDLPVLDAPFNFSDSGYTFPSMRQSLVLSTEFYETAHWYLAGPSGPANHWAKFGLIVGFDVLTTWTPLGSAWLHEEWHRAVMSNRQVSSYDDVYNFPIGSSLIAVSHVADADLVALKRDHPAEQVRLSSAGMESQVEQNLLLEQHHFFYGSQAVDHLLLWLNAVNVVGYLNTCASSEADTITDRSNDEDGRDVEKRDFTGLDCTAWAYDLFRPDEPYAARGVHPSGVGINRYIRYSDLSDTEQGYLHRQANLTFLNFADPFLFGFESFQSGPLTWNAKLSHSLTSFGYTVDLHGFVRVWRKQFFVRWHNGFNHTHYFPGLTAVLIDQPLMWPGWFLSAGATLWPQPRGQEVRTEMSEWTAAAHAEAELRLRPGPRLQLAPYLGLEAKTHGWQAGRVSIDRNVSLWTGLRARL